MAWSRSRQHDALVDLSDERDVHVLYNAHGPELYRFVHRQLRDASAAQDVVQEVFLRAWRRAESYDPAIASIRTWLFGITRNVMIDQLRRDAVRPWQRVGDGADLEPVGGSASFDERIVDAWVIEEALRRLSSEHRDAIVQTHLRQRPYEEVAAEQEIPVGTLRSRVYYGLKGLHLAIEEMGVEP